MPHSLAPGSCTRSQFPGPQPGPVGRGALGPPFLNKRCRCFLQAPRTRELLLQKVRLSLSLCASHPARDTVARQDRLGSPDPGHQPVPAHSLLGAGPHSRKRAVDRQGGASSVFTAPPHRWHHRLSSASCQASGGIRFSLELESHGERRVGGV